MIPRLVPNGPFSHVDVTISDVQANTSAGAGPNDAGWVDLTPKLSQSPQQVDLLGPAVSQCFLANLGDSLQLQADNYQQNRVILSTTVPAGQGKGNGGADACGSQANCVVLADNSIHTLLLSSEAKTGLKIPSGQIANGGFNIAAGQPKDLDIDFDTCDSIVIEGNGDYRLKPVLHAGEVSTTSTSINGVIVDNTTGKPVDGLVEIALEQMDANGVDRISMSTIAGTDGAFVFCPLPTGTYDLVIVGRNSAGVVYSPTVVTGVAPGQAISVVSLHALPTLSTSPAVLHDMVTSQNGATPPAGTVTDVQLSILEAVSSTLTATVPLVPGLSPIELSLATSSSANCPAGTDCVSYDLNSMTIALVSALAIGEFFTALVINGFVLAAEILEGLTVGRGRRAIQDMLNFLPQTASVLRNGQTLEVATDTIVPGEVVLIRPGSRIPVDGQVVSGHSFVEEAAITGEPMPNEKTAGSTVYAGAINQTGTLQVLAERLGKETTFGKIIEAVERAEHSRAPIQKTADRLAGYLVYFALGAAVLTFLITHNIRATISVVIVAGACGIAAGTPLAILGAIGRAARQGSIIKGGIYLEALGQLDTVFLDKTGTLTYGMPLVTEINAASGISEQAVLKAAASAESGSEHLLGRAIVRAAEHQDISLSYPDYFEYRIGRGVLSLIRGEQTVVGNRTLLMELGIDLPQRADAAHGTEVLVAQGGHYLGSILVTDQLRDSSAPAVRALTDMGIKVVLLTGDATAVAEAVADRLGIIQAHSELLPEQKAAFIAEQVSKGHTVTMVGDGINDAPALSEATVGIAMGAGTDVARESADVVLIGNDLMKFVETVRIARNCRRIIFQNFYGTLIVDTIGIGLAAVGLLNPLLAAFIHVASELTFILNSTRLLPREEGGTASHERAPAQV